MAYDAELADRTRMVLADVSPPVAERAMFGGLTFMVAGHMTVGILGDDLMVRVGPTRYEEALAIPGARPMDFTGRTMTGMVSVSGAVLHDDATLEEWIGRGLDFTTTLTPK